MEGSRLVVALDVLERERALAIARTLSRHVAYIKINWPLILSAGPQIVSDISAFVPVICDLKLADIPNTQMLIAREVERLGAFGVIAHFFVGTDSIQAISEAAPSLKVIGVVAMTHHGSSEVMDFEIDKLIALAGKSNVWGVIAPGNKPQLLSRIKENLPGKVIFTPGIGAQGGNVAEAIKNGSDYIIVGRSIYESEDPLGVIEKLNSETQSAFSTE